MKDTVRKARILIVDDLPVNLKPGKLNCEEFMVMKTHAQIGAETLEAVSRQHSKISSLKWES
ncbi:MAG: hypothetical protein ACOYM2_10480 [Rectinemataceae bacterium]